MNKVDNQQGQQRGSKRKRTEGEPVATQQHPVLGQEHTTAQGAKTPAAAKWGKVRNKGCRAHNGKSPNTDPSFMKEKVYANAQLQGRSFKFSQALA